MEHKGESSNKTDGRELKRGALAIARLRMAGEIDEMMRYFAPDVIVHYHCTKEGLFLPGVLHGRDSLKENIRLTDVEYEPLGWDAFDVLVENASSAIRWRSSWRRRPSGRVVTLDMAHFMHWKNGVVVELFEYLDYHGWGTAAADARIDRDEAVGS